MGLTRELTWAVFFVPESSWACKMKIVPSSIILPSQSTKEEGLPLKNLTTRNQPRNAIMEENRQYPLSVTVGSEQGLDIK
jgi:hypothetical protein